MQRSFRLIRDSSCQIFFSCCFVWIFACSLRFATLTQPVGFSTIVTGSWRSGQLCGDRDCYWWTNQQADDITGDGWNLFPSVRGCQVRITMMHLRNNSPRSDPSLAIEFVHPRPRHDFEHANPPRSPFLRCTLRVLLCRCVDLVHGLVDCDLNPLLPIMQPLLILMCSMALASPTLTKGIAQGPSLVQTKIAEQL